MTSPIEEKPHGAPIEKFLAVARAIKTDVIITPEIFVELIEMAARLEEIEKTSPNDLRPLR